MKFELKHYKSVKIKDFLKNNNLIFFYHSKTTSIKNWINIEQELSCLKLNYYRVSNSITLNITKSSILKQLLSINGPIIMLKKKKKYMTFPFNRVPILKLLNLILFIKLNNKIYSLIQLKYTKNFHYIKTITLFKNSLKCLLKIPSKKLLKSK